MHLKGNSFDLVCNLKGNRNYRFFCPFQKMGLSNSLKFYPFKQFYKKYFFMFSLFVFFTHL